MRLPSLLPLFGLLALTSCSTFSGAEVSGGAAGQGGAGAGGSDAGGAGGGASGAGGAGGGGGQGGAGQGGAGGGGAGRGGSSEGGGAGQGGAGQGGAGQGGSSEGGGAGQGGAGCEGALISCEGACVDLESDATNCGDCGKTCAAPPGYEATCQEGVCGITCGGRLDLCGISCKDTRTDPENCGGCGVACAADQVCSQGVCAETCGEELVNCGASCVDPSSDPAHCGGCGKTCVAPSGTVATCTGGTCGFSCGAGSELCSGACVNLSSDPVNCGACGVLCGDAQVCVAGACTSSCPENTTSCGGLCINTKSDPQNCGACGSECPAPAGGVASCENGACGVKCLGSNVLCGENCVNTQTDVKNCGSCGALCPLPALCEAGTCKFPAVCGNGKVEFGEQCDGGPGECAPAGFKPGSAPCKADCKLDTSVCVPLTCGDNKKDAGEECDGFINTNCAGFLKEGFGGDPKCLPSCKADLSGCAYCGDGKRDEHEACEGADLGGATCNTLGAGGSGSLSCKSCQLDMSGCAVPVCGNKSNLDGAARWPAEGGCMARPNQSSLVGPASAGVLSQSNFAGGAAIGSPLVATDDGLGLFFHGTDLFATSGSNVLIAYDGQNSVPSSPVLLPNGGLLRVSNQGAALLGRMGSSWGLDNQELQPEGSLTTNVVVIQVGGVGTALYARGGALLRLPLNTMDSSTLFSHSQGLRGSMAHDAARNRLYVAEDCTSVPINCRLFAVGTGLVGQGQKIWEKNIGIATTAPCHVALGPGGQIYTACGSSARFIHPDFPDKYSAGFNTSINSRAQAPAVASDGTVFLLFADGGSSTLFVSSPQLKSLWTKSINGEALAAPLLDRDRNVYVCTQNEVSSFDKDGNARWSYPLGSTAASWCSLALSGEGQLDVVTSSKAIRFK